jgi:hypothetical protein
MRPSSVCPSDEAIVRQPRPIRLHDSRGLEEEDESPFVGLLRPASSEHDLG